MKLKLIILFLLLSHFGFNQTLTFLATLPDKLSETSGVIVSSSNEIWTHNDGGNSPKLFKIDTNGNILDSITLLGVNNIDFEDVTVDEFKNVYVGDFGNNAHNRTNLVIYKIPNLDSIIGNTVTPQKIFFHYSDQVLFPDTAKNKDCEAMIHLKGKLYLFSKNWGTNGYTKRYELPDSAGNFTANLLDSFQIGGMVTSADIYNNKTLVILEMGRVHFFDNFIGSNFFSGRYNAFSIPFSQTEAIAFLDSNTFYLTQEDNRYFPDPILFKLDIGGLLGNIEVLKFDTKIYPNPSFNSLTIKINSFHKKGKKIKCKIMDSTGKTVRKWKEKSKKRFSVDISSLTKGKYYLQVKIKKQKVISPFIKM